MKLEFAEEVEFEVAAARDTLEAEREGLGGAFLDEIDATLARIVNRPHQFPALAGTRMRRALTKRFPYMVVFAVHGGVVRILCVSHQHRDPAFYRRGF